MPYKCTIPKGLRSVCTETKARYAIDGALVQPTGDNYAWLTATNGRVAVVAQSPMTGRTMKTSRVVPRALLPTRRDGACECEVSKDVVRCLGREAKPMEGKFPPVEDVLAEHDNDARATITIDIDLLHRIATIIGVEPQLPDEPECPGTIVTISIDKTNPKKPMLVAGRAGCAAVIMPINADSRAGMEKYDVTRRMYQKFMATEAHKRD